MLLECAVSVHAHGEMGRWSRAKVGLCKQKKTTFLMVTTAQKSYKFSIESLKKIHSAALEFREPNRIVNLKDADSYQLKVLMKQCAALATGKMDQARVPLMSTNEAIKPNPTSISVVGKNYPKDAFKNKSLQKVTLTSTSPIPKSIWDLHNLTSLTLTQCKLRELPPAILKICSTLKILDLSQNVIRRIEPFVLGRMTSLVSLDLSHNCLRFLPLHIGKLKKLSVLNLSDNKLHSLPFTFAALDKLKELNLSNNCISGFNQVFMEKLSSRLRLISIDLSNNQSPSYEPKDRPFLIPDLFSLAAAKVLQQFDSITKLYLHLPYDMEDYIHIRSEVCCSCKKAFLRFNTGTPSKIFYLGRIASTVCGSVGNYNYANQYTIHCFYCEQKLDSEFTKYNLDKNIV
ncbi:leucine-rich repeat protein lrrA [Tetranychus urticae]|uniref:Leucine-rich repeat protein 1 n=1 Tax=Tetranychus urticae TaxID=32264 RepID=T1K5V4_TETUR|nr:leucine-rich repeat protein lrrA [Tetranychus urticae]